MYNSNFFEEEFVPSIYRHFMKTKEDEYGNEKPVFISEKQFNVIAKNAVETHPYYYEYDFDGLTMITERRTSKVGKDYFTVKFVDNFMDKYRKSAEAVLEHLTCLREENYPNVSEYADEYFKAYSGLIRITELQMIDEEGTILEHAKELNKFYVQIMLAINKFRHGEK